VLTASTVGWLPAPTFGYQWYADNVAIAGATDSTYPVTSAVLGKRISVKATAAKAGFPSLSRTSWQTAAVTGTFNAPAPRISGTKRVGRTLKVLVGTWTPKPAFSYRWYANGRSISGATRSYLRLTSAHRGKRITVKVTGKKTYYTTLGKTSAATAKVTR